MLIWVLCIANTQTFLTKVSLRLPPFIYFQTIFLTIFFMPDDLFLHFILQNIPECSMTSALSILLLPWLGSNRDPYWTLQLF